MRHIAAIVGLVVGSGSYALAAPPPEDAAHEAKVKDIRRLMEMTGAGQIGIQVMDRMMVNMKQAMPDVPETFWTEFRAGIHPDELVALAVPVYDKYLTHDEIKQLIAFNESPLGKKVTQVMPQIMQECMGAGEQWGRRIAEDAIKKLDAAGYKPKERKEP
ncbi:MAG: DUF2059 domain-containing protein [Acidobacteriota bacterium]